MYDLIRYYQNTGINYDIYFSIFYLYVNNKIIKIIIIFIYINIIRIQRFFMKTFRYTFISTKWMYFNNVHIFWNTKKCWQLIYKRQPRYFISKTRSEMLITIISYSISIRWRIIIQCNIVSTLYAFGLSWFYASDSNMVCWFTFLRTIITN